MFLYTQLNGVMHMLRGERKADDNRTIKLIQYISLPWRR